MSVRCIAISGWDHSGAIDHGVAPRPDAGSAQECMESGWVAPALEPPAAPFDLIACELRRDDATDQTGTSRRGALAEASRRAGIGPRIGRLPRSARQTDPWRRRRRDRRRAFDRGPVRHSAHTLESLVPQFIDQVRHHSILQRAVTRASIPQPDAGRIRQHRRLPRSLRRGRARDLLP